MFLLVGLYNIIQNAGGNRCEKVNELFPGEQCPESGIMLISWVNKKIDYNETPMNVLAFFFVLLGVVASFFFRRWQVQTADECDRDQITPSDYTIMVKNIPRNQTVQDIKNFFTKKGKYTGDTKIEKVVLGNKIGPYIDNQRKLAKLELKRIAKPKDPSIKAEIEAVTKIIEEFEKKVSAEGVYQSAGVAFITFSTDTGIILLG